MKTSLDCIPCFVRQALEAARLVSSNVADHEKILRQVLRWSCDVDMNQPPPVMGQRIHRFLREIVNIEDPYRDAKDRQNRMAMNLLPEMKAIQSFFFFRQSVRSLQHMPTYRLEPSW